MDTIIPPCELVPPEDDGPNERTQRDLEHGEVQPGQPHTEPTDEEPYGGRDERTNDKAYPQRPGGLRQSQGHGVSPHPIKDPMMKLKHPSVAHDQIEAHGQERGDVDQSEDIDEESRNDEWEKGQKDKKSESDSRSS